MKTPGVSGAVVVLFLALVAMACVGCGLSSSSTTPTSRASPPVSAPSTTSRSTPTDATPAPPDIKPAVPTTAKAVDGELTTPDGRERTYHVYVPTSLAPGRRPPLLVALHGGTGTGQQYENNSGYDGLAEANKFIVVYPDGIEVGGTSILAHGRVWNGGRCCGPAASADVDDVTFISMLIDKLTTLYRIDRSRIYATGHSNGAIMSYRLACELADKIVAIGLQAGSLEVDTCHPSQPVSVLHIHGTADKNLPIGGGKGDGIAGVSFHPPLDAIHTLARADGCPGDSTTAVSADNPDVTVETWQPCRSGSAVEFVRVKGASHAWMGHESGRAGEALTGPPYMDYDSSAAIWAFLASHPRP